MVALCMRRHEMCFPRRRHAIVAHIGPQRRADVFDHGRTGLFVECGHGTGYRRPREIAQHKVLKGRIARDPTPDPDPDILEACLGD